LDSGVGGGADGAGDRAGAGPVRRRPGTAPRVEVPATGLAPHGRGDLERVLRDRGLRGGRLGDGPDGGGLPRGTAPAARRGGLAGGGAAVAGAGGPGRRDLLRHLVFRAGGAPRLGGGPGRE